MREGIDYRPRRATERVTEAMSDTRVIVLNGARQVGKSTLAEKVLREYGGVARLLDDGVTRAAAAADPSAFVRHDGLMLIDEVQRVPDLWLEIKYVVDHNQRPGQFLLTGSARLLALRSLPDALPGRSETVELWPFSQGEIDGAPDGFVDAAFAEGAELRAEPSELRRKDYLVRAARGGYPEALRRDSPRRRARFFNDYLADLIARDVKQVADIERAGDMRTLISLLAAQTTGLLSFNRLSGDLELTAPTVRRYVEILETIYLVRTVPAWSANTTTRALATPKVFFVDSGIAAHLGAADGALLENFVLGELARQLTWSETFATLHHYRDRDQYEVDAVLEDNRGRVIGIEVKAAESVRTDDFRGLRLLQRRLGERFYAGFVLYTGRESFSFGDGMTCLPISALWTS
ncbi:ATP-binding protein [Lentzea californiensis]|uniref:ATP-binding protein n=1 Tax=Lentzea californiensis TaxID=438851 RepID=UPI0021653872|nr:ATP-binding protein [Lentzea californiensis]